jgi:ERCC4-related helicase
MAAMDQTKHEYGSLKTITREGRKERRKEGQIHGIFNENHRTKISKRGKMDKPSRNR